MATYSIKDIEQLSGIKAHTLRIWEKRYNILEPKRTLTNIRYYDDEDLKKILNVSVLNRNGFKISNIANLTEDRVSREILSLTRSAGNLNGQVESIIVAMIDFDESKFDKIFNNAVINLGFEETMINIVYPFFEKVGILWQTGNINPAQEHFISNLIRQKLIVAIDSLVEYPNTNSKKFLLFLPDGEWHELGLLFYTYFIKKYGHQTIYLGSSTPLSSVLDMESHISFDFIITSVRSSLSSTAFKNYLLQIATNFESKTIYLLGGKQQNFSYEIPHNFKIPIDLKEFKLDLERF